MADQDVFNLLLKAFLLNPILLVLLAGATVLGVILAYIRGRKLFTTVIVMEGVAIVVYTCLFLFFVAPVLGIGAVVVVLTACLLLWRANLIQQHGPTIVVAALFAVILLAGA